MYSTLDYSTFLLVCCYKFLEYFKQNSKKEDSYLQDSGNIPIYLSIYLLIYLSIYLSTVQYLSIYLLYISI